MKRILFLFSSLVTLTCFAQSHYIEMLKEGRIWNCMSVYDHNEQVDNIFYSYKAVKPTVHLDRECFEIIRFDKDGNQKDVYHVYEENGKVFQCWFNPEVFQWEWLPIYDFSLGHGDLDLHWGDVYSSDTICVNGVYRHRISFLSNGFYKIVEGIGNSFYGPIIYDKDVSRDYRYSKLLSVYDGDELIFEEDDFMAPAVTAIKTVTREKTENNALYDLQGRRLTVTPQRGMYIRDGKKYVVKE